MTEDFTFEASAALIDAIGQALLASPDFADDGWVAMALVVRIEGSISLHGFKYYADGTTKPAGDVSFDTALKFVELADQMEGLNGKRWKTCLVHITKPELKIGIQYEYDNLDRWRVTPANLDAMRESLRPA